MIFFEKLLKQRFTDKKREDLWEKYTYGNKETTGSSYLVNMNQDKPITDNWKEENHEKKRSDKRTMHMMSARKEEGLRYTKKKPELRLWLASIP